MSEEISNALHLYCLLSLAFSKARDFQTQSSVCLSQKLTWLISSKVLKIEHWYLAFMILVTSPFNWHHDVTLTFDLLQSQSCCRAGDHNFPNLLVIDKPAFRTNFNEAVLTGEIPPPPTFINLWWNNCDKAFSIFQNFVKVKVNIICWKKWVPTYVKFFF